VIEPFRGKAGSDEFFGLIVRHYEPIKQYLDATVAGSPAKQDTALKDAVANGNALAVFLSGATGLPVDAAREMLLVHVGHHVQQIEQLHDHQYGAEAQTWTDMRQHMYVIADGLAERHREAVSGQVQHLVNASLMSQLRLCPLVRGSNETTRVRRTLRSRLTCSQ
jgi:hypothetical protein